MTVLGVTATLETGTRSIGNAMFCDAASEVARNVTDAAAVIPVTVTVSPDVVWVNCSFGWSAALGTVHVTCLPVSAAPPASRGIAMNFRA